MNILIVNKFDRFYDSLVKLIKIYLLGVLFFTLFRCLVFFIFGNFTELVLYKTDLLKAFWVGFRFDTVVLTYSMIPIVLLMLAGFIFSKKVKYLHFINSFLRWYFVVIYFLLFVLLTIDFFFFKFFQSHFNLLVFGIIEDDTKAILQSVWSDYPVIRLFLLFIAFLVFLILFLKKITTKYYASIFKSGWSKSLLIILFLGFLFLGMRGSLGTFPLEKDDTVISQSVFINSNVTNGVYALKDALADRADFSIDTNMNKTLQRYGFTDCRQAIETYLGKSLSGNGTLIDSLFCITPTDSFLVKNPPNIIFILMESMSNYYIDFHDKNLNLLGSLEQELKNCILYRNFLSINNGTISSLEGIMINTPLAPISQSQYFQHSFSSSCAKPFFDKGYHTAFITGAKLGWRNLGKFVGKQYFQQVEGNVDILSRVAGASQCEWGTFDGFMFARIFDCLSETANKNKPVFIFSFSTSNHTPFEYPASYKPYSIIIPDSIAKVIRTNVKIAQKNFTNYQYANDCLGKFIERVRNSPFGKNTIIAVSGDHNTLQLFNFSDGQLLQKNSVPLVLYVPDLYKKKHTPDNKVFASQKDIFPTLYNLALSDAIYVRSGFNLFDSTIDRKTFYGVNSFNTAINDFGAVIIQSSPLFFKWSASQKQILIPTNVNETPELNTLMEKARAYSAVSTLLIQQNIKKNIK